ncbi:hypothetical protein M569_06319, partial [Genlisea aurea]
YQVIIFGSFTKEEVKSIQCQPPKENLEIKFGSFDLKTLRSVGVLATEATELYPEKECILSNPPSRPSISPVSSSSENTSNFKDAFIGENGFESSPSSAERPASARSGSVSSLPNRTALYNSSLISSTLEDNVSAIFNNGTLGEASKHPVVNESIVARSFIPRGLINLGNLCFLNATLQALLSCRPFFDLLQELRCCHIPEV